LPRVAWSVGLHGCVHISRITSPFMDLLHGLVFDICAVRRPIFAGSAFSLSAMWLPVRLGLGSRHFLPEPLCTLWPTQVSRRGKQTRAELSRSHRRQSGTLAQMRGRERRREPLHVSRTRIPKRDWSLRFPKPLLRPRLRPLSPKRSPRLRRWRCESFPLLRQRSREGKPGSELSIDTDNAFLHCRDLWPAPSGSNIPVRFIMF
jgi:hypothetical protein